MSFINIIKLDEECKTLEFEVVISAVDINHTSVLVPIAFAPRFKLLLLKYRFGFQEAEFHKKSFAGPSPFVNFRVNGDLERTKDFLAVVQEIGKLLKS